MSPLVEHIDTRGGGDDEDSIHASHMCEQCGVAIGGGGADQERVGSPPLLCCPAMDGSWM
jgi:hypothetical protein